MAEKTKNQATEEIKNSQDTQEAPFGPVQTKKAKVKSKKNKGGLLKKTKPKQYVDGGNKVFTQDVETKFESELKNIDPAMQRLITASQNHTYLTAKVSGKRYDDQLGECALCFYGDETKGEKTYQVLIPWEKFANETDEYLEQIRINKSIYIERRIGSTIDFIPDDYVKDGNEFMFTGNRLEAMALSCYEHWFATNKGTDQLAFNVGSYIEARVVGKFPKAGIRVELFGVETTIPVEELSWTRIDKDLSSLQIDVGDNIVICITKLKRDNNKKTVEFEASLKKTMPDPRIAAFDRAKVGDTMHGTISNILFREDDISKSRVFILLDGGGEAMCARFDYDKLRIGKKVSVRIGNKYISDEGEPRLEAIIKHVFDS